MSKYNKYIVFSLLLILAACGTVKEGFSNQKKNSSDEFLVEKKSPLVMPPNYNELPIPKVGQNKDDINENHVKKLLTNKKKEDLNSNNSKKINKNFEDTILEKIKNN